MQRKNNLTIIAIVTLLFAYSGTCYLSGYYILAKLANTTTTTIVYQFVGYIAQALGMLVYAILYRKQDDLFNNSYTSIVVIIASLFITGILQLTKDVTLLTIFSIVFNFLVGFIFDIYLILLTSNIAKKYRGLCFGISYAIGSLFTFLSTYFDGGVFVESPEMMLVYAIIVTIVCVLLLKVKNVSQKPSIELNNQTIKYIKVLLLAIAGLTVVMSLGDGIYNFGRWESKVDWRIVRIFYAVGLVVAGIINDKNKRAGAILTYACMSYYLISTFLLNNLLSPSGVASLGYFFMGFVAVYRYTSFADITDEHPQFLAYCGMGLLVSRAAEGFTSYLMLVFPVAITTHMIVTVLCYSPIVILAVILDGLKFSKQNQTEISKLSTFSEDYNLTSREQEIFLTILNNATDDEIAKKLYISKPTVRFHISNILKKTSTKSRVQAKRLFEKY